MRRSTKRLLLIAGMFFLLAAGAYLAVSLYYSERFFPGSYINGIDCSGMTVEEVEDLLADSVRDYSLTVALRDGKEEVIEGSAINFSYVSTGMTRELQTAQNSFRWMYAFFHPEEHEMVVETSYDQEFLRMAMEKLECFDEANIVDPKDAYIEENGLEYTLVPEVQGNRLNPEKTFATLTSAVDQGAQKVSLEENQCYEKPGITASDENLNRRYHTLVKYAKMNVTYAFGEDRITLDAETINSWLTVSETGEVTFSEEQVNDYVAGLAEKYDTYQKDVPFYTSLGETVTVNSNDYGWELDQALEKSKLLEYLYKGEPVVREPVWLRTAWARTGNGIGSTYVEIDYTNQRMWFYKDGVLVVDTPIVTGNTSRDMGSPVGIFALYSKETNAILKGEDYKTPVDFWMPFYGGVGIHDSKWRSDYGGTIYQTGGSHGCINTPWGNAKAIYESIEPGTPIVCYNAGINLGHGTTNIPQPAETRNVEEELKGENGGESTSSAEAPEVSDPGVTWEENTGSYDTSGEVITIE
jgi:hypothetical protein